MVKLLLTKKWAKIVLFLALSGFWWIAYDEADWFPMFVGVVVVIVLPLSALGYISYKFLKRKPDA